MKNTLKQAQFCFQNNIIIFGPRKKKEKEKWKGRVWGPRGESLLVVPPSDELPGSFLIYVMAHVTDPPQPLVALKISDTNFFLYYYNYHHYCRSIHLTFLHKKNTNNLHQSSWAATTFDWAPSKTCQHHLLVWCIGMMGESFPLN